MLSPLETQTWRKTMPVLTRFHDQYPLSQITDADYDTLVTHLSEQLAAAVNRQGGYPEGEAQKRAVDVLASTYATRDDMTIHDWLIDACRAACVGRHELAGV